MTNEMTSLAKRFRYLETVVDRVVADLAATEWDRQPTQRGGNTARWILAHLVVSRRELLRKIGAPCAEEAWEGLFDQGKSPPALDTYPGVDQLRTAFGEHGVALQSALGELTEEVAQAHCGWDLPDGGSTIADFAYFYHYHESYHVGQLGIIRRIQGGAGPV